MNNDKFLWVCLGVYWQGEGRAHTHTRTPDLAVLCVFLRKMKERKQLNICMDGCAIFRVNGFSLAPKNLKQSDVQRV